MFISMRPVETCSQLEKTINKFM